MLYSHPAQSSRPCIASQSSYESFATAQKIESCLSSSRAFSSSSARSISFDRARASGFFVAKYLRWLCRNSATNSTYSRNSSWVIFSKFATCGVLRVSMGNLSFLSYISLFWPLFALFRPSTFFARRGRGSRWLAPAGWLFLRGVTLAPKEHTRPDAEIVLAVPAGQRINLAATPKRAVLLNGCENLCRHIMAILLRSNQKYVVQFSPLPLTNEIGRFLIVSYLILQAGYNVRFHLGY